jgi:hypothetical protein
MIAVLTEKPKIYRRVGAISIIFLLSIVSLFGFYLKFAIKNGAVTGSSSSCLEQVPSNSTIDYIANSTFAGTNVTFTNGTQSLFPLESCPQPAQPTLYKIASSIERNPIFIAKENGSRFEVDPINSLGMHESGIFNGTYHDYAVVIFNNYSNQTIYPCNLDFISKLDIEQIQVLVQTLPNGSYDLSNLRFSILSESELNIWHCPLSTGTQTFNFAQMSKSFSIGGYFFDLVYYGNHYTTSSN